MIFPNEPMKLNNLLCACFASGAGSVPRLENLRPHWERLIQIAGEESVLPALHSRFCELGASARLPVEIADFLSGVEELSFERNQAIFAELAAVAAWLNDVGIEPVLLKGVAYCATGIYTRPGARYLGDVDLLIPESQLSTAVEMLMRHGFELDCGDPMGRFRHHHPPLRRAGSVSFELHHSIGMGISKLLLPASDVLAQSRSLRLPHGPRVRVPSPDHLMTHLIAHSQIQHPYNERIWPPLRAMYDLVLVQRKFGGELNWAGIQRRFRQAGQDGVLILHLAQVREVLGMEAPFPIHWTGLTRLRWLRRKLLRALPGLRFLDPVYMYSTVLRRRLRLLRNALAVPGGWKSVGRELLAPGLYKRLMTDIWEGRGR
jgi:hypothetical protein